MKTIIFLATFYGGVFHGRLTASGERFDKNKFTCASNYYKIGTILEVTNIANGKSVVVKVNDRGGFKGMKLDLSEGAFKRIANLKQGVLKVRVEKFNEL
jgi:rare lipoprotein A